MKQNKPILCLDFDGVCHSYTSGWKGATTIPDDAVPGLFEFLEQVAPHFDIQVYSTRSETPEGRDAMALWFAEQRRKWRAAGGQGKEIVSITFPASKPSAFIGLDDRVLTFNGTWPRVDFLQDFQPWYKRSKVGEESQDRLYQAAKWMLKYYEENGEEAFRRRHGSPEVLDVCRKIISEGEGNPHPWPTSKPADPEESATL